MRCWYSGSHSHQQTIAYHPTTPSPLSLVWLSFLSRSQDRWWSSWLGILCWLVTPALHLTSITTSNRYRVMTTSLQAARAQWFSHIIICWGGVECGPPHLCTCYNILHILHWQTSPDLLLLFSSSSDFNWLPDHLTTAAGGLRITRWGGEGEEKLLKIILCWRGAYCDVVMFIFTLLTQLRLADISSGHLGRVLILSSHWYCPIDNQTKYKHTPLYSSRVEDQQPRFEIISSSGSLLASFF